MDNDERREMICKLAEQLCGNETKDFALEAVIKAMLTEHEYVEVVTRFPDNTHIHPINKLSDKHYQTCVYSKELYSSERTDVSAADRIDLD